MRGFPIINFLMDVFILFWNIIYFFEMQSSPIHPVVYSQSGYDGQDQARLKPGGWNIMLVSHVDDKGPCAWAIIRCFARGIGGAGSEQSSQDSSKHWAI